MATSAVTGKAGTVSIGGTIAETTAYTVDRNTEAVEATSFDSSGNREFVAGLFGWSGTFRTLEFASKVGAQAAATFQPTASAGANSPVLTGGIIITNEPVSCPVDGIVEYNYTFTGTAALSAATA